MISFTFAHCRYERELRKLRAELQKRSKSLVDKRALMEAEEQTRRAEADKLAVLTALEKRSRELMKEKEEKLALEAKIAAMQSQLLHGGIALGGVPGSAVRAARGGGSQMTPMTPLPGQSALEDIPAFKQILQREQRRIRSESPLNLNKDRFKAACLVTLCFVPWAVQVTCSRDEQ